MSSRAECILDGVMARKDIIPVDSAEEVDDFKCDTSLYANNRDFLLKLEEKIGNGEMEACTRDISRSPI